MRPDKRERGAALLTVLMLVAIIAVMAGAALEKLRLSTRLAANAAMGEQARAFTFAAEAVALNRIGMLLSIDPKRTTLVGDWSDKPFGLPLPGGGFATARVRDGGNCFNLNGLVTGTPGAYTSDPIMRAQFVRLMRLLTVPVQVAEQIAGSTADWIDSDQIQQAMGAEDGAYLTRDPGYRTADTLMSDPSEIRAVSGMTPQIYATLKPWICTLPTAKASTINVNTLSPEQAPLFAMLFPDTLSVEGARRLLLQRPPQGYGNVNDIMKGASMQGASDFGSTGQAAVVTKWFALRVDVTMGSAQVQERALIDASALPARLVSRNWGEE